MKVLLRKRAVSAPCPRLNQWKGARAGQVADQRQQARRERLVSQGRRMLRVGRWIIGFVALAWALTMAIREMGPVLQGWLEIREVEVDGIHHITKPEVLERLALKSGMGLHQVSTAFLAERVRAHAWIKEEQLSNVGHRICCMSP